MNRKRYNLVMPTEFGTVIVNHNDQGLPDARYGVFWQLSQTGTLEAEQMELIRKSVSLCLPDPVVLDIGANIGIVSLSIANSVQGAKIFAFEPQRIIFQMLAGNMALNSIENVFCFHLAVGDTNGHIPIPKIDYGSMASFGSLEFGRTTQSDAGQNARLAGPDVEMVQIVTIDSLGFQRVDFMKIDVEGMEVAVLDGARGTITANKPILCVEALKCDKNRLSNLLTSFGYNLHTQGQNLFCLHREQPFHRAVERFLDR
ncbi:MAG: FkbM family methyltransferase [Syntrophobacteraceae bacterium]